MQGRQRTKIQRLIEWLLLCCRRCRFGRDGGKIKQLLKRRKVTTKESRASQLGLAQQEETKQEVMVIWPLGGERGMRMMVLVV